MSDQSIPLQEIRDDFVPKDAYLSKEYASLEKERLWPRVWQVACREEEIPNVGNYVTYDILDDSLIVMRTDENTIKALYNACQHRGRKLTTGCGHATRLRCRFHGWEYDIDGTIRTVLDREDWDGCPDMADENLSLKEALVDTWAGFVFINMDPDADPLAKYLEPMPSYCDGFEFGKMRFHWYKSVRLPCNWKVALEAFNEGYHVYATHPQLVDTMGDDRTTSFVFGKHSMFGYFEGVRPMGSPSPRTGKPIPEDLRPGILEYIGQIDRTLNAIITHRDAEASTRLMSETSADEDSMTLMLKLAEFQKEAAIAANAGWPEMSFEDIFNAGTDWHVFPNFIFLPWPDGGLFYRSRPDGDNPDSCIFDIWSLQRFAPGSEPALQREYYHGEDDWRHKENFGLILSQDFQNMISVQQGMKARGFSGSRTNPKQEAPVANFHRVIRGFIDGHE